MTYKSRGLSVAGLRGGSGPRGRRSRCCRRSRWPSFAARTPRASPPSAASAPPAAACPSRGLSPGSAATWTWPASLALEGVVSSLPLERQQGKTHTWYKCARLGAGSAPAGLCGRDWDGVGERAALRQDTPQKKLPRLL